MRGTVEALGPRSHPIRPEDLRAGPRYSCTANRWLSEVTSESLACYSYSRQQLHPTPNPGAATCIPASSAPCRGCKGKWIECTGHQRHHPPGMSWMMSKRMGVTLFNAKQSSLGCCKGGDGGPDRRTRRPARPGVHIICKLRISIQKKEPPCVHYVPPQHSQLWRHRPRSSGSVNTTRRGVVAWRAQALNGACFRVATHISADTTACATWGMFSRHVKLTRTDTRRRGGEPS